MTSDELKFHIPMREVVERYGIAINRANKCLCPFHKDSHPSMHIYKDSYYCFVCQAHGDIFSFVQGMDNCDFKTAYISLGGEYENLSDQERAKVETKREIEKIFRYSKEQQEVICKKMLADCIDLARTSILEDVPFSDKWCLSQDKIPIFINWWETKYIDGEEVPRLEIYRKCQEFRQKYDSSKSDNA